MKALVLSGIMFVALINACSVFPSSPYPSDHPAPYPNTRNSRILSPSDLPPSVPTPLKGTGTIVGQIASTASEKSATGFYLYLANLLPLTPGPGHLITIDPERSPKTIVSVNGRFIISNVTPGQYALVLWLPRDSRFIADPNNPEQELIVSVTSGEIVDLGILRVSLP